MIEENKINLDVTIDEVKQYWKGRNIPQQWYSNKTPLTMQWFNEISLKRFGLYYEYLKNEAEFNNHRNEEVLEVGCGLGTDLIEYAKGGANVSGIDLGEDQVELTKLNFKMNGLPYKEIKVGDAEALPFNDGAFDLVFSFGVLHHTPNTQKAIDEVHRVLKDDGEAIIMLYAKGWKHYIKRCFIQGIICGKWFKHRFNWQKVYNEVSEVHGNSPKTGIYSKKKAREMFINFKDVKITKKRLGEIIEYPPYGTFMLPRFVNNSLHFFNLETFLGENWLIKACKAPPRQRESLRKVIFEHY